MEKAVWGSWVGKESTVSAGGEGSFWLSFSIPASPGGLYGPTRVILCHLTMDYNGIIYQQRMFLLLTPSSQQLASVLNNESPHIPYG